MGNNSAFLKNFIQQLNILFSLKNLGPVYYFIGLEIFCDKFGFYLSQREYILDLLRKFDKYDCAPVSTPMVANKHFFAQEGKSLAGPSIYRRAISSLQYLTSTRLDISYSVNKLSQFLSNPKDIHFQGVKRIFRYLKGTYDYYLWLKPFMTLIRLLM